MGTSADASGGGGFGPGFPRDLGGKGAGGGGGSSPGRTLSARGVVAWAISAAEAVATVDQAVTAAAAGALV
jgi:hypothetical protein